MDEFGIPAPIPGDDQARVREIERYAILDTDEDESFTRITRLASEIIGVPIALITLVDEDRQWFKARTGLTQRETPREQAFCGYTILAPDHFQVPDALTDERFAHNPLVTSDPHIRFYAGIPLSSATGQRLGSLCVIGREPRTLDSRELGILKDLAGIAQRELDLHRAASTDDLTGLYNRAGFVALAKRELLRGERNRAGSGPLQATGLMMVDLDHFKQINDTFGHAVGDQVLIAFAQALQGSVRDTDVCGRVGGDEFAVVFPNVDEQTARRVFSETSRALAKTSQELFTDGATPTISAGLTVHKDSAEGVTELLGRADRALYSSKRDGGAQLTVG